MPFLRVPGSTGGGGGVTDHTALTSLSWTICDHTGATGSIALFDALGATALLTGVVQGDVVFYSGTTWTRLVPGAVGDFLQTQGAGADPVWAAGGGGAATLQTAYVGGNTILSSAAEGGPVAITTTAGEVDSGLTVTAGNHLLGGVAQDLVVLTGDAQQTGDVESIVNPGTGSAVSIAASGAASAVPQILVAFGATFYTATPTGINIDYETATLNPSGEFGALRVDFAAARLSAASDINGILLLGATNTGAGDSVGVDIDSAWDLGILSASTIKVLDNVSVTFGTDDDWTAQYDEATDDKLEFVGEDRASNSGFAGPGFDVASGDGAASTSGAGGSAGGAVGLSTGAGGTNSSTGTAGDGGDVTVTAAVGGDAAGAAAGTQTGDGGSISIDAGDAGDPTGAAVAAGVGAAGTISITSGEGASPTGGGGTGEGSAGGAITITSGRGGQSGAAVGDIGGAGGPMTLAAGQGHNGRTAGDGGAASLTGGATGFTTTGSVGAPTGGTASVSGGVGANGNGFGGIGGAASVTGGAGGECGGLNDAGGGGAAALAGGAGAECEGTLAQITGDGGNANVTGGIGGVSVGAGALHANAGTGGSVAINAGAGGANTDATAGAEAGNGGNISIDAGAGGSATAGAADDGDPGTVTVGTSSASAVTVGGAQAGAVKAETASGNNSAILALTALGVAGEAFALFAGTGDPQGATSADTGSTFQRDTGTVGAQYLNTSTGGSGTDWSRVVVDLTVEAKTLVYAINAFDDQGRTFTNQGATGPGIVVFTLPTAVAGQSYTFIVQDVLLLQIVAAAGDTIRIGSSGGVTVPGTVTATAIGDVVELIAINATEWIARSVIGTWTVA